MDCGVNAKSGNKLKRDVGCNQDPILSGCSFYSSSESFCKWQLVLQRAPAYISIILLGCQQVLWVRMSTVPTKSTSECYRQAPLAKYCPEETLLVLAGYAIVSALLLDRPFV